MSWLVGCLMKPRNPAPKGRDFFGFVPLGPSGLPPVAGTSRPAGGAEAAVPLPAARWVAPLVAAVVRMGASATPAGPVGAGGAGGAAAAAWVPLPPLPLPSPPMSAAGAAEMLVAAELAVRLCKPTPPAAPSVGGDPKEMDLDGAELAGASVSDCILSASLRRGGRLFVEALPPDQLADVTREAVFVASANVWSGSGVCTEEALATAH